MAAEQQPKPPQQAEAAAAADAPPNRGRRWHLILGGLALMLVGAVLVGVYGSREAEARKQNRFPGEDVQAKNYNDPYTGLVRASPGKAAPTPAPAIIPSKGPTQTLPQVVPIGDAANGSAPDTDKGALSLGDDDDTRPEEDSPGAWQAVLDKVLGNKAADDKGGAKGKAGAGAADAKGKAADTKGGDAKVEKKLPGGSKTGGYCYPMTGKVCVCGLREWVLVGRRGVVWGVRVLRVHECRRGHAGWLVGCGVLPGL
jgi:hypothetical protein